VNIENFLDKIKNTGSPLKKQLLTVALVSKLLEDKGKAVPVIIGGCALSYYSREVYFTADIDLAYADREALNDILLAIGFKKDGRYWISESLKLAVEVPTSTLAGEDSPLEVVEFDEGLNCRIIGIEDLIIDRLNACKHWKYEVDCEMAELLIQRYAGTLDWSYLERQAAKPDNNVLKALSDMRRSL
jgi:predicted nucleotidyltransferase